MELAILCSLDSFSACLGMALLRLPVDQNRRLILAFLICDMTTSFLGVAIHSLAGPLFPTALGTALTFISVGVAGILIALMYTYKRPILPVMIPFLLGCDNFISGAFQPSEYDPLFLIIAGPLSGLSAWCGFVAARATARLLPPRCDMAAGLCLTTVSFIH